MTEYGHVIGTRREDYVVFKGVRDTRATLAMWHAGHWRVLRDWFLGALAVATVLLAAIYVVAKVSTPDPTPLALPGLTKKAAWSDAGPILYRNSLVLALHAMACVAGFIAGSSLPEVAKYKTGWWKTVHDKAGPAAIAFVIAATTFSLSTQAYALGSHAADMAGQLGIGPGRLLVALLPHAVLELTALFLPLAAWLIASRRDEWHHLMAATFVTVALAVPMLLAAVAIELFVSPHAVLAVL